MKQFYISKNRAKKVVAQEGLLSILLLHMEITQMEKTFPVSSKLNFNE